MSFVNLSGLNELTLTALRSFKKAEGITFDDDDSVFVWVYVKEENGEFKISSVEVNTNQHQPEGVACEIRNLASIEDWFEDLWCYVYDYQKAEWVSFCSERVMTSLLPGIDCSDEAYQLITEITSDIDLSDCENMTEILKVMKDALCDGEYLATMNTNQDVVEEAFGVVEKLMEKVS